MRDDGTTELAKAMDALVVFLRQPAGRGAWSDRMEFWADWVSADAERVRAGDFGGVEHFLSAFGGMGSINDLAVGDTGSDDSSHGLQAFDHLKDRAWQLADALKRSEESAT